MLEIKLNNFLIYRNCLNWGNFLYVSIGSNTRITFSFFSCNLLEINLTTPDMNF